MKKSRRTFIKNTALSAGMIGVGSKLTSSPSYHISTIPKRKYAWNDHIQIAIIGAGGMGVEDTRTALKIPGVSLVAACDLYQGRFSPRKLN